MATPNTQEKIILYYKFAPIADPEAVMFWQKALCEKLNLKGRIIISSQGINGTLGGNINNLKTYVKQTRSYSPFNGTEIKWSDGSSDDFPKLSIKVREEVVTLLPDVDIEVDENGIVDGGDYIKPQDLDKFMQENPDAIFFDGRNGYESAIGKFENAITPQVNSFKEFVEELEKPEYQELKDKKLVTYCTGGIRCEILTPYMKSKGFKNVYQIHGGIVKYGEYAKDKGLWQGKCFVFDNRMSVGFSPESKDIGQCRECGKETSEYINFPTNAHRDLVLICKECQSNLNVGV